MRLASILDIMVYIANLSRLGEEKTKSPPNRHQNYMVKCFYFLVLFKIVFRISPSHAPVLFGFRIDKPDSSPRNR